jgi:hypothetical protein
VVIYLCTFGDASSSSVYVASNARIVGELETILK